MKIPIMDHNREDISSRESSKHRSVWYLEQGGVSRKRGNTGHGTEILSYEWDPRHHTYSKINLDRRYAYVDGICTLLKLAYTFHEQEHFR